MAKLIIVLSFFNSTISSAQNIFDSIKVNKALHSIITKYDSSQIMDDRIVQTIQAIDKNINAIVQSKVIYSQLRFTVIETSTISIRQLVDKSESVNRFLKDTTYYNYKEYWAKINHDTLKLLSGMSINDDYDLNYPNYQYPKKIAETSPLTILPQLNCKNIIFYCKQLNLTIDSIGKSIKKSQRPIYYKYIADNYDYFEVNKKSIIPRPIRILTITYGANNSNTIYAGVDIYGTHYLLTFDTYKSYMLTSVKALWTY